jgi:hypothetical protein
MERRTAVKRRSAMGDPRGKRMPVAFLAHGGLLTRRSVQLG